MTEILLKAGTYLSSMNVKTIVLGQDTSTLGSKDWQHWDKRGIDKEGRTRPLNLSSMEQAVTIATWNKNENKIYLILYVGTRIVEGWNLTVINQAVTIVLG